jgi:hypothetical protein
MPAGDWAGGPNGKKHLSDDSMPGCPPGGETPNLHYGLVGTLGWG